ncbi:MAG TPA: DUF4349 domain-containing protein [Cyclobacteriaceae bacterium]|nr:DUF4349 domain-containing protein [Cyclobacteriaceae bacterium]
MDGYRGDNAISVPGRAYNPVAASFADNQSRSPQVTITRKLIKNGSIDFEVNDIDATKQTITDMTNKVGGYISSDSKNDYGSGPHFEQVVRIPADTLDFFMKEIEKLAVRIDNQNISSNDVTEEFIDVETRLRTKKELEVRYLDLLKQAKNLKDIVEIEGQLNNVRSEIESMEGRLKYLTNQVDFSTLRLNYYKPNAGSYGFSSKFSNTFSRGWELLLDTVIGLFTLWPFIIIAGVATWFFIHRRRRRIGR